MYENDVSTLNHKLLKQHDREIVSDHIKSCSFFHKAFYQLAKLVAVLAFVAGGFVVFYSLILAKDFRYLFYLPFTTVFPCMFSSFLYHIFTDSISSDHKIQNNPQITINDFELVYSYDNPEHTSDFAIHGKVILSIPYNEVKKIEYNVRTRELTLYGVFHQRTYTGRVFEKQTDLQKVILFNVFYFDLYNLLMNRCKKLK